MKKKYNIYILIWITFISFSLLIMIFLWTSQVLFLKGYYRYKKEKDVLEIATYIKNNYQNNIKQFRVREGLTQEELAKKINISRQMIGLIENNKTIPSVEIALKLSKVLKEPVENLFFERALLFVALMILCY